MRTKIQKVKTLRRLRREDILENPEAYVRSTAYEDRRTKRQRTRQAQDKRAIMDDIEEQEELEQALDVWLSPEESDEQPEE